MMIQSNAIGKQIGIVTQISDDENICFIVNNNVKCEIGNIIALEANEDSFVLAEIYKIELEFYLENVKQYFISKAVDNSVNKIADPNNKPRYGQNITAVILGHYELDNAECLVEIKNKINRYTSTAFQSVFLIDFRKTLNIYGLHNEASMQDPSKKRFILGELSYPDLGANFERYNVEFDINIFRKHTLITGVTGAGKSRLSALVIKEVASLGAHVNIFDPHNEYSNLLTGATNSYKVNRIDQGNITFSEKYINPNTLTKLLPKLSEQQELLIFELINELEYEGVTLTKLMQNLVREILLEIDKGYFKNYPALKKIADELVVNSKNHTEYVVSLIALLKKEMPFNSRPTKLDVLTAVTSKMNELRIKKLITNIEPNWLKASCNSVDIFNIDYSANDYVRRFINSIIQFLLRKQDKNEFRVLVIDEAHMLLKEGSETSNLLKQLLREARKFNISVIFITQNSKDISDDIRGQFQNHFNFREKESLTTNFYPDQLCNVCLYGSKRNFAMKVSDLN